MLAKGLTEFWHTAVQHRISYRDLPLEDMVGAKICYADTCVSVVAVDDIKREVHYAVTNGNSVSAKIKERRGANGLEFIGQDMELGRFYGNRDEVRIAKKDNPYDAEDRTGSHDHMDTTTADALLYQARRTVKFSGLDLYLFLFEADDWAERFLTGQVRNIDAFLSNSRSLV